MPSGEALEEQSLIGWHLQGEDGLLTGRAGHGHPSPVGQGNMFDNGQSQTRAANLAAAAGIDPVKPFKDPRQVFRGDARALVPHPDNDLRAFPTRGEVRPEKGQTPNFPSAIDILFDVFIL